MEFAGGVAGVSGSRSGDGECFKMAGALDGVVDAISGEGERSGCNVERVTLYVVDNTRILRNAIVVKHSL